MKLSLAVGALLLVALGVGACSSDSEKAAESECQTAGPGFATCKGGWFHRTSAEQCTATPVSSCAQGCESHPSCGKPNAVCAPVGYGGCQCKTSCQTDAECAKGNICVCGDTSGFCVTASCTSDADCGTGLRCASYSSLSTCGGDISRFGVLMGGLACQTPEDECAGDGDCATGQRCTLGAGHRICADPLPCSS
ncbi:MAG: hypothetical protein KC776_19700 [Myxococcales bacterium]|nr:hypothetical protein [Myxococcales bacterium]